MVFDLPEPLGPTMAENDWERAERKQRAEHKVLAADLVERAYFLPSFVTFEVYQGHFMDDEAGLGPCFDLGGR